eukprot:TRINITY_DN7657_c0_g1_i1.p1 TRINITY_DN7657_c0_g1~~TRINITY_DN7657_c0_g1_i1.p1  ORF type:complete len:896 (-),score=308.82 TRINITY_DN7657_c0_g1_i1:250-2937(-)
MGEEDITINLEEMTKWLKEHQSCERDNIKSFTQKLATLRRILAIFERAEESPEVLKILALTYRLKTTVETRLSVLLEEKKKVKKKIAKYEEENEKLEKELKQLKSKSKLLKKSIVDIKEQVDLLTSLRNEKEVGSGSQEEESEDEDEDEEGETFKADITETVIDGNEEIVDESKILAELPSLTNLKQNPTLPTGAPLDHKARRGSRITVRIQKTTDQAAATTTTTATNKDGIVSISSKDNIVLTSSTSTTSTSTPSNTTTTSTAAPVPQSNVKISIVVPNRSESFGADVSHEPLSARDPPTQKEPIITIVPRNSVSARDLLASIREDKPATTTFDTTQSTTTTTTSTSSSSNTSNQKISISQGKKKSTDKKKSISVESKPSESSLSSSSNVSVSNSSQNNPTPSTSSTTSTTATTTTTSTSTSDQKLTKKTDPEIQDSSKKSLDESSLVTNPTSTERSTSSTNVTKKDSTAKKDSSSSGSSSTGTSDGKKGSDKKDKEDAAPATTNAANKSSGTDAHPDAAFDTNDIIDIIAGMEVAVTAKFEGKGSDSYDFDTVEFEAADFQDWHQFKIQVKNRELLKFKHFAPKVFHTIRMFFGITDDSILNSFQYENLHASKGEGKSGANFLFTKDKQFVLKTVTGQERDFLWSILPFYWQYVRRHPNTLLPRFYGVYSMKHEGIGGMTRFIITNNVLNSPFDMVETYDLKGSTLGRFVPPEKRRKPGVILKDLDILGMRKLHLNYEKQKLFLEQLKKDTEWLSKYKIMDYSFLLGIYYETPENKEKNAEAIKVYENVKKIPSAFQSEFQKFQNGLRVEREDGGVEIYYFGIIDVLVQYVAKKRMEHFVKSLAYSGEEVSVTAPPQYADRFYQFLSELLVKVKKEDEDSELSEEEPPKKTKK